MIILNLINSIMKETLPKEHLKTCRSEMGMICPTYVLMNLGYDMNYDAGGWKIGPHHCFPPECD